MATFKSMVTWNRRRQDYRVFNNKIFTNLKLLIESLQVECPYWATPRVNKRYTCVVSTHSSGHSFRNHVFSKIWPWKMNMSKDNTLWQAVKIFIACTLFYKYLPREESIIFIFVLCFILIYSSRFLTMSHVTSEAVIFLYLTEKFSYHIY